MAHRFIKYVFISFGLVTLIFLNSCYYDTVEELYPLPPPCDTSNITFSNEILPMINSRCTGCHSGSAPSGNVYLESYDDIVTAATNGSLLGTIRHEAGWSPMPKNGAKLDNCTISKLEIWIADGTPNN